MGGGLGEGFFFPISAQRVGKKNEHLRGEREKIVINGAMWASLGGGRRQEGAGLAAEVEVEVGYGGRGGGRFNVSQIKRGGVGFGGGFGSGATWNLFKLKPALLR